MRADSAIRRMRQPSRDWKRTPRAKAATIARKTARDTKRKVQGR